MTADRFDQILVKLLEQLRISDFHFHSDRPLACRVNGEIQQFPDIVVSRQELDDALRHHMDPEFYRQFESTGDVDFAIVVGERRFRANAARALHGLTLILRTIVTEVPNIEKLGLPPAIHSALDHKAGLVLVTGQTGAGKSTSLASMIDKINRTRAENIITVEDPVEFVHKPQKSIIFQREVGRDTKSFAAALKGALRQDPDIILLGELRDYETVSMALTAAETGHLVFGTLHTSGAPETITRIIDAYPAEEQAQARSQLSGSLRVVMTQQLLKRKGGGRVGAFEIMVNTPAVANLIREDKIPQITNALQTGAQHGMITMEKYMEMLTKQGIID